MGEIRVAAIVKDHHRTWYPARGTVDGIQARLLRNFEAIDAAMFTAPVRTDDPSSPSAGEMWVRSDLGELRVRVGAGTYKVALTAV